MTILNVAGLSRLTRLSCSNNQLAELIVKDNIKLKKIDCSCNLLKSINLKNNAGLYELYIEQNQIDILDISNNPWLVACIKNPKYYGTVDNGRIIIKIGICPVLLIRSNSAIIYRQQYSRGDRCEQPPEVRFA